LLPKFFVVSVVSSALAHSPPRHKDHNESAKNKYGVQALGCAE